MTRNLSVFNTAAYLFVIIVGAFVARHRSNDIGGEFACNRPARRLVMIAAARFIASSSETPDGFMN